MIVSSCLLGIRCDHRGGASPNAAVRALASEYRLIPICPEIAGGLPTQRAWAEIQGDGRVTTADGADVTDAYRRGAHAAVALATAAGATEAVLKARSPSCGCNGVYDGSFTKRLRPGDGVTAAALRATGLRVRSEEELSDE